MHEVDAGLQEDKEVFPGIRRNVVVLGLVSLFNDISSEMLYPLVPIFLTTILAAPVSVVGFIEGVAEATASLTKAYSGWLSDRFPRRRPLVTIGYGLSAISKPLLGLSTVWPMVLGLRFGDRLGKGIRTAARDALIADSADEAHRGRAFGFHRALDTAGAVVGPLLALALLAALGEGQLRLVFLLAFIPAIIGVLLIAKVRERPRLTPVNTTGLNLRLSMFDRRFKTFLLLTLVFAIGNSSDVFLILRARDILGNPALGGDPAQATFMAVLAYAFYNVVFALASTPAGILSDRIGRKWVLGAGFVIFAIVYFGFAVAGHPLAIWVLFAIYGFYIAMTEGVAKAFTVDLVPNQLRGTALGSYHMTVGLMTLPASILAGLLWTYVSPAATFALGGVMAVIAAAMLPLVRVKTQRA